MTIEEKREKLKEYCRCRSCDDCPMAKRLDACGDWAVGNFVERDYAFFQKIHGNNDDAPIKGVSPDAPIVTNEQGGMQSKTEYAFHLIDTDAILALAEVLQIGANKYARDNWRNIPSEEHFNHMLIHYYAWLKGDTSDDHLGHMFCRAMMLYATGKAVSD